MKKFIRISSMLLAIAALCSLLVFPTSAASTAPYADLSTSKYATVYTLAGSGTVIPYTTAELNQRGSEGRASKSAYIDCKNDDLRLFAVGVNKSGTWYAKVSYPITGTNTRRTAYIKLSDITANTYEAKTTATGKFYCAARQGWSNNSKYYVDKGDTVWLLAQSGNQVQIKYPVSGGRFRIAWCNKSDYEKYCGAIPGSGNQNNNTDPDMIDVTAYFAGKTITIQSVENGKFLCADAESVGTPLRANKDWSYGWETFTVSGLTSDGWVGLKAHTGKYISATASLPNTPLMATVTKLQSWECYRIYQKGSNFYMKAQVNNKWLCVRVDTNQAPVQAYANGASTWERLNIRVVGEEMYISPAEILRTASENGISRGSDAYNALLSLNSRYASQLSASDEQGTVVAMFEGVGNDASASRRMNAMALVIKNGDIVYLNRNSSTIPDYPFKPSCNNGKDMPTIKSGVYSFTTVNHPSKSYGDYAALNVTNAPVVRFRANGSYYSSTSYGINVHRRDSNNIPAASAGWVNSAGCLLVGQSGRTSSGEYARFIQALGIVRSGASGSTRYSNRISGKIIVDRTWAYNYLSSVGYPSGAISQIG